MLHRCHEHTKALVEEFTLDALWHEYGIVGELVPFTNDFCHADIHELIAPDLLHQIIKGAFKDHLVEWVEKYIRHKHGDASANEILDDIDRRFVLLMAGLSLELTTFQDCGSCYIPWSMTFSTGPSFQTVMVQLFILSNL